MNASEAGQEIIRNTPAAVDELNGFTHRVFQTRGGRIGSGMGSVIEALWGFYLNQVFKQKGIDEIEMGWIYGHEYNDFACIVTDGRWDPESRKGELLRVEVKSMVASADESKAHFDRLQHEFDEHELLAVFLWDWARVEDVSRAVFPKIKDHFVGPAIPIARLRDRLHEERGGSFVLPGRCPDGCSRRNCTHQGEPLNASGVRERKSGPKKARGARVSYAANFGGMLRMLGSRTVSGKETIQRLYVEDQTTKRFLDFMSRNFPRVSKVLA